MAGGMKKAMIYLGLADSEEQYESEQRERETRSEERADRAQEATPRAAVNRPSDRAAARQAAWDGDSSSSVELVDTDYRAPVTPIKRAAQAREESKAVHQLTTIHPRSYNDAKRIGESFRNNIPVIMNVTDMSESEAKRLVDFSAGLVFGLRGSIERVTNKVFLLTPADVEVVTEGQNAPSEETSFFNQN